MAAVNSFRARIARLSTILGLVVALCCAALGAQSAQARYVSPQFFGQHLMYQSGLNPQVPVHDMRLWDSSTKWCQIDKGTSTNEYNFGQLDALFGQAARVGADVEYTFGGMPQWAVTGAFPQGSATDQCASTSTTDPWDAPINEAYWTSFVTALVTHSVGKIHAYELWNAVDYQYYWSGSMAQMVQMSVDAAAIIHRIDPSAIVLSPSITATPGGYAWLKSYLSQLPAGTIDAIAVHSYTHGAWPETAIPEEMKSVRAGLPSAYANTPIWSTEGSWGQNSQFSTTASGQRAFVARYDLQMLTQGLDRSYWYAYQNSQWGTLFDATSQTLTPAGVATRTLDGWLTGSTLAGCSTVNGNLWTCNLTTSAGKKARIVWTTKSAVRYSAYGFNQEKTLDGSTLSLKSSIQTTSEPVMLTTK
jgi:hypothetical protein